MSEAAWVKLIEVSPGLLWVVFAVVVLLVLRSGIVAQLHRMTSLRTPFGEADFEANLALMETAVAEAGSGQPPTLDEQRAAISRLDHAAESLRNGRVLWVDDNPGWNSSVVRLLERSGMRVEIAVTTEEALTALSRRTYDLLITDMRRGNDGQAGQRLVEEMAARGMTLPIVLFTLNFDPRRGVHPSVFAYTTAVDELLHFVIDIMERVRFARVAVRR
ncbi:response regulator [Micromonospora haikouensis]|uniref:response regulator n=1 Tax=Micromonospora haikouensis TaxID=686309 RepID=UPI003D8C2680